MYSRPALLGLGNPPPWPLLLLQSLVFFAAIVVVVGYTPTRSAPRHVSFLLVLPNCRPCIFDC
jgi:hypothetical protein